MKSRSQNEIRAIELQLHQTIPVQEKGELYSLDIYH